MRYEHEQHPSNGYQQANDQSRHEDASCFYGCDMSSLHSCTLTNRLSRNFAYGQIHGVVVVITMRLAAPMLSIRPGTDTHRRVWIRRKGENGSLTWDYDSQVLKGAVDAMATEFLAEYDVRPVAWATQVWPTTNIAASVPTLRPTLARWRPTIWPLTLP